MFEVNVQEQEKVNLLKKLEEEEAEMFLPSLEAEEELNFD